MTGNIHLEKSEVLRALTAFLNQDVFGYYVDAEAIGYQHTDDGGLQVLSRWYSDQVDGKDRQRIRREAT